MNPILTKINKHIQSLTTVKLSESCAVWQRGGFLHIALRSTGCNFRKMGSCTMCDYGFGDALSSDEILGVLDHSLSVAVKPIDELLIGSCGSILDNHEIEAEVLDCILDFLSPLRIPTLIFETHYTTINAEILAYLRSKIDTSSTEIVIEMGMESSNPLVLENCLNKHIDLDKLSAAVQLIKHNRMGVVLNVLLGAPFLTPFQQLHDALDAIRFAVSIGADRVDVFPVNIKPNTLVGYLHRQNRYNRLSLWMIAELLYILPDELLGKVEMSWFGERQHNGISLDVLQPSSCHICDDKLFNLINRFMDSFDISHRRGIIKEFFAMKHDESCNCYSEFRDSLKNSEPISEIDLQKQHKILEWDIINSEV